MKVHLLPRCNLIQIFFDFEAVSLQLVEAGAQSVSFNFILLELGVQVVD